MINTLLQLIANPAIISLSLGFLIGVYSIFRMPTFLSSIISLYLIFAIGLKGGLCLGVSNACTPPLIFLAIIGIALGLIQPFIYFNILNKIPKIDTQTKAVISSQYGSISIVTFVAAMTFLEQHNIHFNTFMSAIAGAMEIPAIVSGLFLLKSMSSAKTSLLSILKKSLYDIFTTPKVTIIFVGFIFGYLLREHQNHALIVATLYPFTASLILFMIDIGIKIAEQRAYIYQFTWPLIGFGIITPIVSGICAIGVGYLLNISIGSLVLFAVLIASASYIAVPAIMAIEAPQAKKVIYLPLALAITLPFNLLIGIPLFYSIAQLLCRG